MAGVTSAVVAGVGTLAGVSEGRRARKDAKSAARAQAEGVQQAQEQALADRQAAMELISPAFDRARQDLMSGTAASRQDLRSGYRDARPVFQAGMASAREQLNPIAQLANPALQEASSLLNLRGEGQFQNALSRVNDPLQKEQERAFARNVGITGQVGGGALSQLAEMTRARTEANIGNRIAQLQGFAAPGVNAISNIAQLFADEGRQLGDISMREGQQLSDISMQDAIRRANLTTGQAQLEAGTVTGMTPELTQLSQNLGVANSGGAAFAAGQNRLQPIMSGLEAGLGLYGTLRNLKPGGAATTASPPPPAPVVNATPFRGVTPSSSRPMLQSGPPPV